jgi:hypothetical protein
MHQPYFVLTLTADCPAARRAGRAAANAGRRSIAARWHAQYCRRARAQGWM